MDILHYVASVSHDNGTDYIKTTATCDASAITIIARSQGCPEEAINLVPVPQALFGMRARKLYNLHKK